MRRLLAPIMALLLALLAVVSPAKARADEEAGERLPRDVSVVAVPSGLTLPALPGEFVTVDGGWISMSAPLSVRDRITPLLREADDFRARLSEDLGQPVLDHVVARIARTPDQMAQLAPEGAPPPPYAAAVAYPSFHLVLLAMQAPETWEAPDLSELLRHELAHIALDDAIGGRHLPLWFNEGLAIRQSGELPWARMKTLWDASLGKRIIPLAELDRGFPSDSYQVSVAYAESADFVAFLMRDEDRVRFGSLIERVRSGARFDRALEDAYGTGIRTLEYQWREEIRHRFSVVPMLTGGGIVWVVILGLSAMAWTKRRRLARAKLEQWDREEAEIDAAVAAAERARAVPGEEEGLPSHPPSAGVVEHEGRWYTLH